MNYVLDGDLEAIAVPLDLLGVNYYFRQIVRNEEIPEEENEPRTLTAFNNATEMGWEVYPEGLYDLLTQLHREYDFPALMIMENGAAYKDHKNEAGEVHDPGRIHYLSTHLREAARAIQDGVPLHGYFAWSLMDNFEWGHGFRMRFGLIYVDFETLERTPKSSALWYRDVIAKNQV